MLRSKFHRPWQPHVRDEGILNPFAHTTEPEASLAEHEDLKELDELAGIAAHHEIEQLAKLEAAERSQTGKPPSASAKAVETTEESGLPE